MIIFLQFISVISIGRDFLLTPHKTRWRRQFLMKNRGNMRDEALALDQNKKEKTEPKRVWYLSQASKSGQAKCMEANFQIQFRWNKRASSPLFSPNAFLPFLPMQPNRSMFACFAIHSYLLFYTSEQNILLAKFPWLYKILLVLPGWGNSTFIKAINEKNEFYIAFNKIAATLLGYLLMDGMEVKFQVVAGNIYWLWNISNFTLWRCDAINLSMYCNGMLSVVAFCLD